MVLFAKDIVEKDFLSMAPGATVLEPAKAMAARHHGFVIVEAPMGTPIGIVTEWDVLAKVVAAGRDPADVRLESVMTHGPLVSVDEKAGIDQVAQTMAEKGTRRVLVVEAGKVIGVIRVQTILARLREFINAISAQIARGQTPML